MRWTLVIILIALTLSFQTTLAPRWAWGGARPDWVLVMVVFWAMHAPMPPAAWLGAAMGIACDLLTVERAGVFTLSYGLTGYFLAMIRDYIFIYEAWVQILVTFLFGLMTRGSWLIYAAIQYPAPSASWWNEIGTEAWAAFYTALFAPVLHFILLKFAKLLGLRPPRYQARGKY